MARLIYGKIEFGEEQTKTITEMLKISRKSQIRELVDFAEVKFSVGELDYNEIIAFENIIDLYRKNKK